MPAVTLNGSIAASTAGTGALSVARSLVSAVLATTALVGAMVASKPLASACTASSASAGTLGLSRPLASAVTSSASLAGLLNVGRPLAGAVAGTIAVAGALPVARGLGAAVPVTGAAAGLLNVGRPLASSVSALALPVGSLGVARPLVAAASATTSATGVVLVGRPLVAAVTGSSSLTGSLFLSRTLAADVQSAAFSNGNMRVARLLTPLPVVSTAACSGELYFFSNTLGDWRNPRQRRLYDDLVDIYRPKRLSVLGDQTVQDVEYEPLALGVMCKAFFKPESGGPTTVGRTKNDMLFTYDVLHVWSGQEIADQYAVLFKTPSHPERGNCWLVQGNPESHPDSGGRRANLRRVLMVRTTRPKGVPNNG